MLAPAGNRLYFEVAIAQEAVGGASLSFHFNPAQRIALITCVTAQTLALKVVLLRRYWPSTSCHYV
jgi:hypothetical protein